MKSFRIAIGSDHGGFEIKKKLIRFLSGLRHDVRDVGCFSTESYDFPVSAYDVAHAVSIRSADRGILIDGAGSPSAMVANKVPGVRASVVHDEFTAKISREHSDANVIAFGAKVVSSEQAATLVELWLRTEFLGGKYQKRIDMVDEVERRAQSRTTRRRLISSSNVADSRIGSTPIAAGRSEFSRAEIAQGADVLITPLAMDLLRGR